MPFFHPQALQVLLFGLGSCMALDAATDKHSQPLQAAPQAALPQKKTGQPLKEHGLALSLPSG
jgi:hypothetical protein